MHDVRTDLLTTDPQTKRQADGTLRWGGLAGMLGSVLMLVTFGVVAAFVGMEITPEQSLARFPDIRVARTVENSLYLGVLVLWVLHCLALYRGLRRTSPTPALFGTALSILGLVVLAAGALPHVATAPLSDLYHAAGATPQDQATLVLVWHGIHAMFDALLFTGLAIVPLGGAGGVWWGSAVSVEGWPTGGRARRGQGALAAMPCRPRVEVTGSRVEADRCAARIPRPCNGSIHGLRFCRVRLRRSRPRPYARRGRVPRGVSGGVTRASGRGHRGLCTASDRIRAAAPSSYRPLPFAERSTARVDR